MGLSALACAAFLMGQPALDLPVATVKRRSPTALQCELALSGKGMGKECRGYGRPIYGGPSRTAVVGYLIIAPTFAIEAHEECHRVQKALGLVRSEAQCVGVERRAQECRR